MTLKELLAAKAEIGNQLKPLFPVGGKELSAEERLSAKELLTKSESLDSEIAAAESLAASDAEMQKKNAALQASLDKGRGRRTQADPPGDAVIGNARLAAEADPKKGFKSPREFMLAVMEAGQRSRLDERLYCLASGFDPAKSNGRAEILAAGSDEARGNYDPTGGFLVPEGFHPTVLQVDPEDDPTLGQTTIVPMELPIVRIPARTDKDHTSSVSGGLTVTRKPETVGGTSSVMTMEQVVLQAHNLFGLGYATEELLTDSPISFAALLAAGFNQQFAYQLLAEKIGGTGVGEFQGVLNAPCLVSVTKETGQAATTFVYENALKMRSRCWGYGKAIWLANHDAMPQMMLMNQAVGTGGAIVWQPSARQDAPDLLLGRPLFFTEFCQTIGTVGDVILGNWSQYLEGTYQPMQSAESIHVRFVNHERTFKFWLRNAGQPWWKTALTPKVSTQTLSPFVVTATRS